MIAGGLAAHHDEVVAGDAPAARAAPTVARRVAGSLGLLALYVVAMAAVTWPLVTSLRTHHLLSWWGPPFDLYQGAWAMAWQTDALFRRGVPIADANIFFPDPGTLYYGQTGWGALPLFAPVYLLTRNPTLAINLTFLLGLALTAWGIHLVVRRWTGSTLAGGVAAATFATNPWVTIWFVPTAPQWAALFWLPWLAALACRRHARLRDALWLVPLVVLQALTDVVYLAPAVLAPLAVQAAARIARRETRPDGLRMAIALALSVAVVTPFLLPYLQVRAVNPDLATQTNWSGGLLGPGLLTAKHPVYVTPITAILIMLGIGCVWLRRRTPERVSAAWSTAALWAIVGLVIALPPVLVVGGVDGWHIPTPLGLLQAVVPAAGTMRATGRLGIVGLIGLALLSGLAFAAIQEMVAERMHDRQVVAVVTVAMMALYLSTVLDGTLGSEERAWPRVLKPAPTVPPAFEAFLRLPGRAVLQLPLGARDGTPAPHAMAMYRSIGRWYPLINGYASYWPHDFPSRMRLARHVPDPEATQELARRVGLGMVWVDFPLLTPHERKRWDRLFARGGHGLVRIVKTNDSALYVVSRKR